MATAEEIKSALRPKDMPGVMGNMFDEVVDYVLNNYGENGVAAIEAENAILKDRVAVTVDNEKIIDELKTIVFATTNATGEGDLDSALRLYFEKKSVVENSTEMPS